MPTLPTRDMEITQILVPRGNRETLRSAKRSILYARHVVIAGQLEGGHVQKRRQQRERGREWMSDPHRLAGVPGTTIERVPLTACFQIHDGLVELRKQEIMPTRIGSGQHVHRLLMHQLPQR